MYLHDPMEPPPGATHLEFPPYGSWACAVDSTHVEFLTHTAWVLAKTAYRSAEDELLESRIRLRNQQKPDSSRSGEQRHVMAIGRQIVAAGLRRVGRLFSRS